MMLTQNMRLHVVATTQFVLASLAVLSIDVSLSPFTAANELYSRITIGAVYTEPTASVGPSKAGESRAEANSDQKEPKSLTYTSTEMYRASDLVGTWVSTETQGEVIAIRFFDSGRFTLAIARPATGTSSLGQFILQSERLILVGDDGHSISAKLKSMTKSSLTIRFSSGREVAFGRLP